MTRIAYLVSSANTITMADGKQHPTGYFAEEALKPYERFVAAGLDVIVMTPDGRPPTADPYGLRWFFHYTDEDKDYLASVVRTFAHDVDDIRFTLHQNTELDLAAARRIAQLLRDHGHPARQAHAIVSRAARRAWSEDRSLVAALAEDPDGSALSPGEVDAAVAAQRRDSEELAAERKRRLDAIEGFAHPASLHDLSEEELSGFDAVFVPGGHGPMADLAGHADVGRLLVSLQSRGAIIASLCHGPAFLLSAPDRADGQWLFDGYRMTCFTDEEEDQTEPGRIGLPWYVDTAIKNAGAVFDDGPAAWNSHVVVDRNLITGQNPGSTEATADAVIKALASRVPLAA